MAGAAGRLPYRSRYQALIEGAPAWAVDDKGALYQFDGLCFTRRRRRDRSSALVPSWQTPAYGWLRASDCPCAIWIIGVAQGRPAAPRAADDHSRPLTPRPSGGIAA